jgi:DNA mismatch endonuclease (patch repair protein)
VGGDSESDRISERLALGSRRKQGVIRVPLAPVASSAAVRATMQGNKKIGSTPERNLQLALKRLRLRFTFNVPLTAQGATINVDLYFPKARVVVLVDGCFWHGCRHHGSIPSTNRQYWAAKIARNKERDRHTRAALRKSGYRVVRVWEHEGPEAAAARIADLVTTATGC